MADLFDVADMIVQMADGFAPQVLSCLESNVGLVQPAISEQLYCGVDGDGKHLAPSYSVDPFFDEPGPWQGHADAYRKWKAEVTPPVHGTMLDLPPRPDDVPNLWINGKFHSEIFATMLGDVLRVDVAPDGDGPDIVHKYGEQILRLGPRGIRYFAQDIILPHIWRFFAACGW